MAEVEQQHGVVETKELALGAIALGFHLAKLMKDGFQMADLGAFLDKLKVDAEFAAKLEAAYKGVEHVPAEMQDLDVKEALDLGYAVIPAVIAEIQGMAA